MHFLKAVLISTFILNLFNLLVPREVYAYINPGVGSYFIQAIIAVVLGGLFAIKIFWNKIKNFFRDLFKAK